MASPSDPLKRHNELLRALQQELAAKEQELASQKWLFEQFLQSPSWRLTEPIRSIVRKLRAARDGMKEWFGSSAAPVEVPAAAVPAESESSAARESIDSKVALPGDAAPDLKTIYSAWAGVTLESFLLSGATLDLPAPVRPVVSIIVILFNRAELTLACLRSLTENRADDFEVIIVDNNSTDATHMLLDRVRGARIIRNSENRNFLLAVNQAARQARGENLLLLNNDAQLLPGSLRAALETLNSAPDIGAVGGKIVLLDGALQEAGSIIWRDGSCLGYGRGDSPFAPMYMFRRDVDYCSGAFLLTPRSIWEELGGFDEIFRPAYYEETDYCTRLWQRGYRVVYEPRATIVHYEFASSLSQASATGLQREHQRIFAERHAARLSSHENAGTERALFARSRGAAQRVLFLDDQAPHHWLGSGFPRAQAMLRGVLRAGCFVTLYPMSVIDESWNDIYSDIPHEVEVMTGCGPSMLEAFLRSRKNYYTTILVSRPHNMQLLQPILAAHPEWFEETRLIYDAEALFASRQIGLRKLSGNPMTEDEITEITRSEISLAGWADSVVSVSEGERLAFESHGIRDVHVLGHCLTASPTPASFQERSGLLFVGAVHDEASPNGDSLIWFLSDVLPRLREHLGHEPKFTIAGVNKSPTVRKLAAEGVVITGHLADLTGLYNESRVFIAPTRYAAGIPHKIHEAAMRGLPVVTTPLLAGQLNWSDRELAIADSAETFAARCAELYTDPALWQSLRQAALERATQECSVEAFDRKIRDIITGPKGIRNDPESSRFANAGMDR